MAAHLLALNVAAMGPVVCLWLHWRDGRRGDELAGCVGRRLAATSIAGLVVGTLLGGSLLAALWLADDRLFFEAAGRVPARRYWFGAAEWVFSLVCLGGYLLLWRRWPGRAGWGRLGVMWTLAVLGATNLLYHFPTLFAAIAVLEAEPARGAAPDFMSLLARGETLARLLHFALASVAVSGLVIMGDALRMRRLQADQQARRQVAAWGGRIALVPTLLQWLAGTYLLVQLPEASRAALLGGDWIGTSLFGGSLLASVALMHQLAAAAMGDASPRSILWAMTLMALTVLLMVAARQQARQALAPSRGAAATTTWERAGAGSGLPGGAEGRILPPMAGAVGGQQPRS